MCKKMITIKIVITFTDNTKRFIFNTKYETVKPNNF